MSEQTVMVEINGVKMEIDTRRARRIETLRVGSRVKVLVKQYGDSFKVHPGVIVGFDEFKELPTITVCYLDIDYTNAALKFLAYNAKSKDIEIVASNDADDLDLSKSDVLAKIDKEIAKKKLEQEELQQHRAFFLSRFAAYFDPLAA